MTPEPENEEDWSFELEKWQRWLSALIGLSSGAAGSYAVFVSENQAGTAILLIASVAFLLIGIQGTPLSRFGSGEHQVAWRKVKRKIEEQAVQAHETGQPELARTLVDYAQDPVGYSPQNAAILRAIDYEKRIGDALKRIYSDASIEILGGARSNFDYVIHRENCDDIGVIVKYASSVNILKRSVYQIAEKLSGSKFNKIVVVTNFSLPQRLTDRVRGNESWPANISIVSWNSSDDDGAIINAIGSDESGDDN